MAAGARIAAQYFGIGSADDAAGRRKKVCAVLAALDLALSDALPYLFGLLGVVEGDDPLAQMDGQIKKRRTLDTIKRILLRESLNQPLIVVFEDLHWIDEQTQEFLNLLADSIGRLRSFYWSTTVPSIRINGAQRRSTRSCGSIHSAKSPPTKC